MIHDQHQGRTPVRHLGSNLSNVLGRASDEGNHGPAEAPVPLRAEPGAARDGASKEGQKLSKRQRRRRRKGPPAVAADHATRALHDLPPSLSAKLTEAERALRARDGADEAPPAAKGRRRRRGRGRGGAGPAAVPATHAPAAVNGAIRPAPARRVDRPENDPARIPTYAALDLGTNNCRLLIATPTRPGQFRVIDAFSRIVRLGEGLGRTGSLAAGAMDRAVAALEICSQKLSAREISGARLIATEACRSAANGAEFIERVQRDTGLALEIVTRETEARLAVSGCGSLVDRSAKGAVLFDIGGGSTEIALLDLRRGASRRLSNHIVAWTSLPVGVVTLAERHGGRDVPPEVFERMIREVEEMIAGFSGAGKLDDLVGGEGFHLLGTSGTVTTLAGVQLELERYDRRQVDGLWLASADIDRLVGRIAGWSFEERVANPCIGSERADLVLAGCAILEAIRRVWPARTLRVADRGLREGLLTEMMVADGVWRRPAPTNARQAV